MAHEEQHNHVRQLHEDYLLARRAFRVGLRIHLESRVEDGGHGVQVGGHDPEKLHRDLHKGD